MFVDIQWSVFCLLALAQPAQAPKLSALLARMDEASASFHTLTAGVKRLQHTQVINDDSEEIGAISIKRTDKRDLWMLLQVSRPDAKTLAFHEGKVEIYYPKINTVQEYDFTKQGALVDQFLMLGFGTSGKELAKNYDLKIVGEETVAGHKTTRLELIPKSAKVRENFTKFELWVTEGGYPVQQKLYQSGGDYNLVTYSDLKWNPNLGDDAVRLKLPKGVNREYPQK